MMPCNPARARMLLREKKAFVLRKYPFTIILKDRADGDLQPMEFKVDPGSKKTGVALVADFSKRGKTVVWAAEIQHRGQVIKNALDSNVASGEAAQPQDPVPCSAVRQPHQIDEMVAALCYVQSPQRNDLGCQTPAICTADRYCGRNCQVRYAAYGQS